MESHILRNQLGIELCSLHFLNTDKDFLLGHLLKLFLEIIDFRSLFPDDDHFAYLLHPYLGGALSAPGLREWAARILMLVLILLAGSVLGTLVSYLINRVARLAATDRLLGLLFGLVRALVVAGIFVLVGKGLDLDGEKWWKSSRLMPYAEQVASWLSDYAEPAVEPLLEEASGLVRG